METIPIEFTKFFVKIVQHGGFTKAAQALGVPKSTLSKALQKLELETGTKLMIRSTRQQTLTAAGRVFYEACLGPIQKLEEAQKSLYGQDTLLSGKIKITAPEDLGSYIVSPAIAQLCQRHPKLSFELLFTNQVVDLIKEGFDMAVRIGNLKESQMKMLPLGHLSMILVASPSYLAHHRPIATPADLKKHECLTLSSSPLRTTWHLKNNKIRSTVNISSRLESNHMTSLLSAATAGGGVLLGPNYLCKDLIKRGELVRILPDWSSGDLPVSVLTPLGIASSGRLRVVAEELSKVLKASIK